MRRLDRRIVQGRGRGRRRLRGPRRRLVDRRRRRPAGRRARAVLRRAVGEPREQRRSPAPSRRYSTGTEANGLSVTALGYYTDWDATDQIARRAVEAGTVRPARHARPDERRHDGPLHARRPPHRSTARSGARTRVDGLRGVLPPQPVLQLHLLPRRPRPRRPVRAGRPARSTPAATSRTDWLTPTLGQGAVNTVGADVRHDQIFGVGLFEHAGPRARRDGPRRRGGGEHGRGLRPQIETRWTRLAPHDARPPRRRLPVRRRQRHRPTTRASRRTSIASPKVGVALGPWRSTEVYANAGLGFHSNDARGTDDHRRPVESRGRRPRRPAGADARRRTRPPDGGAAGRSRRRSRCGRSGSTRSWCSSATRGGRRPATPVSTYGVEVTNHARRDGLARRDARRGPHASRGLPTCPRARTGSRTRIGRS